MGSNTRKTSQKRGPGGHRARHDLDYRHAMPIKTRGDRHSDCMFGEAMGKQHAALALSTDQCR